MKILVISPMLCSATAASGGSTVARTQLIRLTERHQVSLLALVDQADGDALREEVASLRATFARVQAIPNRPTWRTRLRGRLAILRGWPSAPVSYWSDKMRNAIRDELIGFTPDVTLIQFPEMAQYVDVLGERPAVMDVQDAFCVSKYRRSNSKTGRIKRSWRTLQWLSWIRYERHYYSNFRSVVTISEQDRLGLLIFEPELKISVNPPLLDPPTGCPPAEEPDTIGFVASFAHAPNIEAIEYFTSEILPRIRIHRPSARFLVAGRSPPPDIVKKYDRDVEFVGFVDDVYAFNRSCAVMVAPLLSGGGVKIKTIEAMIAGACLVSTPIGAEEVGAEDGVHIVIRSDPAAFADAICNMLGDPSQRRSIGDAAKDFGLARFTSAATSTPLEAALAQACAPRPD